MKKNAGRLITILWISIGILLALAVWFIGENSDETELIMTWLTRIYLCSVPLVIGITAILRKRKHKS